MSAVLRNAVAVGALVLCAGAAPEGAAPCQILALGRTVVVSNVPAGQAGRL